MWWSGVGWGRRSITNDHSHLHLCQPHAKAMQSYSPRPKFSMHHSLDRQWFASTAFIHVRDPGGFSNSGADKMHALLAIHACYNFKGVTKDYFPFPCFYSLSSNSFASNTCPILLQEPSDLEDHRQRIYWAVLQAVNQPLLLLPRLYETRIFVCLGF